MDFLYRWGAVFLSVWLGCIAVPGAGAQASRKLDVTVRDQQSLPIVGVQVNLLDASGKHLSSLFSGTEGHALFEHLSPGFYRVEIANPNFENWRHVVDLSGSEETVEVPVTLLPSHQTTHIDISEQIVPSAEATTSSTISRELAKHLPDKPATVTDALPLVPGVVREPGGALVISDSPEHRAALIVNSTDVTDPATGQFGLTVPIDSVEAINVYQAPFLAEYGRFTAGLVAVDTRRGGDKWNWELNDPLPEFFIRSWHLRGLRTATPRLNFSGPLINGKLFISEGFEYEVRKVPVYTLPFPNNQIKQDGFNTFTQLDWVASQRQLVTATLHIAPRRIDNFGINYFNPVPTSPDATTRNYTGTLADRFTVHGAYWENTLSITQFHAKVWAKGPEDLVMSPAGNSGNYFASKDRTAGRIAGLSNLAFAPVNHIGVHQFKVGVYAAGSHEDGQVEENPVDIVDMAGRRLQRITFNRNRDFDITDVELSFFAQDHWLVTPRFSLDLGGRVESQQISGAYRVAPRAGFAWTLAETYGTTLRGGFGLFYDRVPLNVYCFNRYPDQVVTDYGPNGEIIEGPIIYLNTLGQVRVRHPFTFQEPKDGNFSPRSLTTSLQLEQPIGKRLRLRTGYMQSESDSLVILNPIPPDPGTNIGSYLLSGIGSSRYWQFETTARVRLGEERELMFSYVRSKGRGDLNDFGNFLGTFPTAIVRPNQYGNLPGDLPNRFLAWGLVKFPKKIRISPVVEYRNGFVYTEKDALQNWVGVPNDNRFPNFFSVDARISKDIQVTQKYAVRLALASFNLTNHFNPEAVHSNVADPAYGYFFGHRGRRFTVDFDFLF